MSEQRKLKGINFTGTLDALAREHGPEVRARVEHELRGEVGEALRHRTILASGWYPASWYAAILEAIVAEVDGDDSTVRILSREAVKADFATLFRIVRLFLSPQKALLQSMRVSSRYVDGGEIEVVEAQDGGVHYRFREYHGYTRLMWWDFIGGIEGVLETLGAKNITSRMLDGGGDGDHHCELQIRWI
ncbi:MAG: DUF2378 family protein [Myxococcales bacterium]|nr:DUF2378 family protein [Myxococcales bacterium]